MKKIIIVAILISNISYANDARLIPTDIKCHNLTRDLKYCEMSNGDACYFNVPITGSIAISCFKG